jgi:fumarate hydratase class I
MAKAWERGRLRASQLLPLSDWGEAPSRANEPLAAELFSAPGAAYRFLFVAKGGGSSNKAALFQETKAVLRPVAFRAFARRAVAGLGVSACPPYRIAMAVGGQSPEEALLAAKLASCGALDALAAEPPAGGGPYRDRGAEDIVIEEAAATGWGAQFGGRYLARDARVVRLPRHAASLPIALAVSCAAHRQLIAYVDKEGYFVERLAGPDELREAGGGSPPGGARAANLERRPPRRLDLALGMKPPADVRAGEFVELYGPMVLARDAAHARLRAMIERGENLPAWTAYPAFYASPSGAPDGSPTGSLGPTTSRRMDGYAEELLSRGAFRLMLGKGERSAAFADVCRRYGGLYLAAVGGAAALAAERYVRSSTLIDWPELGMEAIRLVELDGLPAVVAVDASGVDFYERSE